MLDENPFTPTFGKIPPSWREETTSSPKSRTLFHPTAETPTCTAFFRASRSRQNRPALTYRKASWGLGWISANVTAISSPLSDKSASFLRRATQHHIGRIEEHDVL